MQAQVFVVSLALIAALAVVFLWIIRSEAGGPPSASAPSADNFRRVGFWGLAAFGAFVTYVSLSHWPHAAHVSGDAVVVNATGSMWSWDIDKQKLPVDTKVVFRVTSLDVNHGLGVTDPSGAILFQTQAMPSYINEVAYTFRTPGIYEVICLEYCGLVHHDMRDQFEVVAKQ